MIRLFFVCVQHIDRQGHITRDSCVQWTSLTKFSRFKTENSNVNPSTKIFLVFTSKLFLSMNPAKNGEKCSLWSRLVGEGRFWYGITCFYEEVCWNYEPKTLHFPLVVTERASSFFQLAELLFSFSFFNLFLFFFERARDRLGFSDIDKKNSKWDINDSLFALLLVFFLRSFWFVLLFYFRLQLCFGRGSLLSKCFFFCQVSLVFQISFGFSMVMRFKSLGSYSAFDFLSFFKFFCFRLDFSNRQRCFLVFFKFLILS